jgi:hypothetical protein
MDFTVARPDVVRAINQRWLLKFWKRHLGEHQVPPWQAVETDALKRMSANLSLLDVVGQNGGTRFLIRYHGAAVGEAYGSQDCRGKMLDEVIPAAHQAHALIPYRQAVDGGRPIYTVHDVADCDGRLVHFERLLLPFGRDGRSVDRILASFEFVSPDGAFQSRDLMRSQKAPPALRVTAQIDASALS